jgi:outer membrane immunogenic protein
MLSIKTLGASAAALVAGAGMALAADLPNYQPPPAGQVYNPVPAYDWNGPYLGLTGGYGWGTSSGWLGGVYAGYNFQVDPHWIVGLEGDGILTNKSTNSWDATVRGRLGYAYDRFLFYGTGGIAFGDLKNAGASTTKVGWTLGAGIEAAITSNVTGRLEYRHTDLGSASVGGSTVSQTNDDLMVGIGFKF